MEKAGLLPIRIINGELEGLFMISSNAKFGGSFPMLSKGSIEDEESPYTCAWREAYEELGLVPLPIITENIKHATTVFVDGMYDSYHFHLYYVFVDESTEYVLPGYETSKTIWLSLQEFKKQGRKSHYELVKNIMIAAFNEEIDMLV